MGKTRRYNVMNHHGVNIRALAEHKLKRWKIVDHRGGFVRGYHQIVAAEEIERLIDDEMEMIVKQGDDRKWFESGANRLYKDLCKKERRVSDKRNINKVMMAIDEDAIDDLQLEWQTDHHQKHHIWSVW